MNEDTMMHARDWNEDESLAGWIATEKLDGVRAYWDGRRLWSRGGNVIKAPSMITDLLPRHVELDGELWAGRGNFERVRLGVQAGRWHMDTIFAPFDAPEIQAGYSNRVQFIQRLKLWSIPLCVTICNNRHAIALRSRVQRSGGEGLVVYNPWPAYQRGLTRHVLKVK